jgi:glucose-1-phosphate thymidylyltransferase
MKALVLAAGYGTRLYPLTKYYPKALLAVGTRPMLNHILDKLEKIRELDEIIVVTNSKFYPIFKEWSRGVRTKKRITIVDDLTRTNDTRRGAVGDIAFVINKKAIKDDLLVIGGDNLFEKELAEFIAFTKKKKGSPVIGVFDLKDKVNARKYGVIKLDRERRVVDFQEKPKNPNSTLVGMCLYYFPVETFSLVKKYEKDDKTSNDASGSYIDWLRKETDVYGFIFRGKWFDIGDFKYLDIASRAFAK